VGQGSHEPSDELERGRGGITPAAVDREGAAAVVNLDDHRHSVVALLQVKRRIGDRLRDAVVLLA